MLVVEHRNRLTRYGYSYFATLLKHQGRRVEAVFPTDTDNDLIDDFVTILTSMAASLYGRRNAKQCAARIPACIKHCVEQAEEV